MNQTCRSSPLGPPIVTADSHARQRARIDQAPSIVKWTARMGKDKHIALQSSSICRGIMGNPCSTWIKDGQTKSRTQGLSHDFIRSLAGCLRDSMAAFPGCSRSARRECTEGNAANQCSSNRRGSCPQMQHKLTSFGFS